MIGARTKLLRSPDFVQTGRDLEEQLETWIASSDPFALVELLDEHLIHLLGDVFERVGGCEGTVWLADRSEGNLVAVYNSGIDAESLIGFEQPIGTGIISMVFSQQQPYCENEISSSAGHDDTLDKKISKHTTAMIAVPFYFAFGLRGVISCVQLEESPTSKEGFSSSDVAELGNVSNIIERLINEALLTSALGLSDG